MGKFYAVKRGRKTGIFTSWEECKNSIDGYKNAVFKSFNTHDEAEAFLNDEDIYEKNLKKDLDDGFTVIYTDGSFDEKSQYYGYGAIIFGKDEKEIKICDCGNDPDYIKERNIAGEVFGVISALIKCIELEKYKIKIFYDYEGIGKWAKGEWKANSKSAQLLSKTIKQFNKLLDITFVKVAGHSNNKHNEEADALAKKALNKKCNSLKIGLNCYVLNYFNKQDLDLIINFIEKEFDINIEKRERASCNIFSLTKEEDKLTVSYFTQGKLMVQGKINVLFQIFTSYILQYINEKDVIKVLEDAYSISIDVKKLEHHKKSIFSNLYPDNYNENIIRLIDQAIINLDHYIVGVEYSQYVFPAFRALEGHIKWLFYQHGIIIKFKSWQTYFIRDNNRFKLRDDYKNTINDEKDINNIENCYNYFTGNRNLLFHFGIISGDGTVDDTTIIYTKEEANELIKKCLNLINSSFDD
ncbi:MAG TPA: reverse transcriptase-like protein [Clostridiales bacterium]|nr:reverse transcriptase-like protein [Clostridiales bacterium]